MMSASQILAGKAERSDRIKKLKQEVFRLNEELDSCFKSPFSLKIENTKNEIISLFQKIKDEISMGIHHYTISSNLTSKPEYCDNFTS